jgi:hypothetical protein
MKKFSEIFGWIGMVLVVSAYFLITFGYITAQDTVYPAMNFVASSMLLFSVWEKKAWAAVGLQIILGIIALISLVGMIF